MGNIFNFDNKFFRGVNKLVDCFYISVLWMIFSIPVITAGASWTAMYYTVNRVLRTETGYVWRSFFGAFRSNFRQSTILWLITAAAEMILGVDAYIMRKLLENGNSLGMFYFVFLIMLAFLVLFMCYVFSYTARFTNTVREILKNCAIIAIANLPKTLLLAVILVLSFLLVYELPFLILLVPALAVWVMNPVLESVFRKYMTPEDLEREKELDIK